MWSPEGFCQRCLAGPWECTGRSSGPASASSSSMRAPPEGRVEGRHEGDLQAGPSNTSGHVSQTTQPLPLGPLHPASGMTATGTLLSPTSMMDSSRGTSVAGSIAQSPIAPAPYPGSGPSTMANMGIHHQHHPHHPHQSHSHSQGHSHTLSLSPPQPQGMPNVKGTIWNGFLSPADNARQLHSYQQQQPLFEWPPPEGQSGMQAGVLTTCTNGNLTIDTPLQQVAVESGVAAPFWSDPSQTFTSPTSGQTGPSSAFNAGNRLLVLNSDRPMRQGVSLSEIYARVIESWLVGLPAQAREYARSRILALNDTNSVMRAVRYAVAAAYIFVFAPGPHGESSNPKPKLVELAIRGAGLPEEIAGGGSPLSPHGSQPAPVGSRSQETSRRPSEGAEGGAIRKLSLYVDHVSAPFSADLESTKWTEDALQELRQTIVTSRQQLSDLLWGVSDLQLVEFIRGGAAASYDVLALGDRLVRDFYGSEHPTLTISDLRTAETFSLRLYALSDVSRCIVQRGRRTIFNLNVNDVPRVENEEEPWLAYLGLPDTIAVLLAAVVNLCADAMLPTGRQSPSNPSLSISGRAEGIETALRNWKPSFPSNVGNDSRAFVSRTIAGELWRNTALILLYQSVYRVGGLHPILRRAQAEILSLLSSITQLPGGDLWGFIALPAFLAACLSTVDEDRKLAMSYLVRTGPERVWLDNIALVEKIWEETDRTGHLADWHELMVREGLSVAFF